MRGDNLHNICLKYASHLTHWVVGVLPPVVELIGCSGLWLKGGGLSTQWKADIYNQPWCLEVWIQKCEILRFISFEPDGIQHSKCVINLKKMYTTTSIIWFFFFLQTTFNISLFIENSWKWQSTICFLIKFRPHNYRQTLLLFLFMRLLRNNVVIFTDQLWLRLWWWT